MSVTLEIRIKPTGDISLINVMYNFTINTFYNYEKKTWCPLDVVAG